MLISRLKIYGMRNPITQGAKQGDCGAGWVSNARTTTLYTTSISNILQRGMRKRRQRWK